MTTAITTTSGDPMKDFQQRVTEKLKVDIGALMPDEVLIPLVQKAIQETFYTKTFIKNPNPGYSRPDMVQEGPSWFQQAILDYAKPLVDAAVKVEVAAHKAEIDAAVQDGLSRDKLIVATANATARVAGEVMGQAVSEMVNQLRNQGIWR